MFIYQTVFLKSLETTESTDIRVYSFRDRIWPMTCKSEILLLVLNYLEKSQFVKTIQVTSHSKIVSPAGLSSFIEILSRPADLLLFI